MDAAVDAFVDNVMKHEISWLPRFVSRKIIRMIVTVLARGIRIEVFGCRLVVTIEKPD